MDVLRGTITKRPCACAHTGTPLTPAPRLCTRAHVHAAQLQISQRFPRRGAPSAAFPWETLAILSKRGHSPLRRGLLPARGRAAPGGPGRGAGESGRPAERPRSIQLHGTAQPPARHTVRARPTGDAQCAVGTTHGRCTVCCGHNPRAMHSLLLAQPTGHAGSAADAHPLPGTTVRGPAWITNIPQEIGTAGHLYAFVPRETAVFLERHGFVCLRGSVVLKASREGSIISGERLCVMDRVPNKMGIFSKPIRGD